MNKFFSNATAIIAGFILFVGCNGADKPKTADANESQPAFDLAGARKEIDSINVIFMDLVGKGDSVGLANFYAEDAKMMGPNQPAAVGRKNIQTMIGNMVGSGSLSLNLVTLDLWGDESILAEEGRLILSTKDGKQLDKGKYVVLWKKEDGKWKLFRDFFNSDLPLPSSK